MAYYSTQETSAIEPAKQFESRWKKGDRKEEVTEVSMKLCLFFLFARISLSGLYRWRTSIRTKFFSLNAGAIDRELWSTLKISIRYSVSVRSFQRVIIVFLFFCC